MARNKIGDKLLPEPRFFVDLFELVFEFINRLKLGLRIVFSTCSLVCSGATFSRPLTWRVKSCRINSSKPRLSFFLCHQSKTNHNAVRSLRKLFFTAGCLSTDLYTSVSGLWLVSKLLHTVGNTQLGLLQLSQIRWCLPFI